MSQVIRVSGELQELTVKNTEHVGEEGARRGVAVLPDGQEVPVYNHPENGTIWYEQMGMNEWLASQIEEEEEDEGGPELRQCPYCYQMHQPDQIEQCPLKPKQGNGTIRT